MTAGNIPARGPDGRFLPKLARGELALPTPVRNLPALIEGDIDDLDFAEDQQMLNIMANRSVRYAIQRNLPLAEMPGIEEQAAEAVGTGALMDAYSDLGAAARGDTRADDMLVIWREELALSGQAQ